MFRFIAIGISTLCVGAVALAEMQLWVPWPWVIWTEVAVIAVVAIGSQARALWWEGKIDRWKQRKTEIDRAVKPLIAELEASTGYDLKEIGVNVFLVEKIKLPLKERRKFDWTKQPGRARFSIRRPRKALILDRIYRERWHDYPEKSGVEFREGKGVIGQCWAQETPIHVDLRPSAKAFKSSRMDQAAFDGMSDKYKFGFDLTEFRKMSGKYGEMLAVPIISSKASSHLLGCLAIDIPVENCVDGKTHLGDISIRQAATTAARQVRMVLESKPIQQ